MIQWLKRVGAWKWSIARGPFRLIGPTLLGAFGMALVAGGSGWLGTMLGTLFASFVFFAVMRRYGRALPAEKAWPRWLTWLGIAGVAAVGIWALLQLWTAPALAAKLLGSLAVLVMGAGTSWIAWRQVELLQGTVNRTAAVEEELGDRDLDRARRAVRDANGWVDSASLAQALGVADQQADELLDHLYVKGELAMEIHESGGVLFRWDDAPRMTSEEFADEELERLLKEE